jgi:uncharacterized protein
MNPIDIIEKLYYKDSITYGILVSHGKQVAEKALQVASKNADLKPDLKFIEEAAMLHDIGIFLTDTPDLCCIGDYPYICHGYLGRELLEKIGFPKHGLVCERHIGVGITLEDVKSQDLLLPERDMVPISIEEQIVCYADKFFSKGIHAVSRKERTVEEAMDIISRYGPDKTDVFMKWVEKFGA